MSETDLPITSIFFGDIRTAHVLGVVASSRCLNQTELTEVIDVLLKIGPNRKPDPRFNSC